MNKDDVMDVGSYILMVFGIPLIIISYKIEDISGFVMGAVGLGLFFLGLKLQILYSIEKDRVKEEKKEKLGEEAK